MQEKVNGNIKCASEDFVSCEWCAGREKSRYRGQQPNSLCTEPSPAVAIYNICSLLHPKETGIRHQSSLTYTMSRIRLDDRVSHNPSRMPVLFKVIIKTALCNNEHMIDRCPLPLLFFRHENIFFQTLQHFVHASRLPFKVILITNCDFLECPELKRHELQRPKHSQTCSPWQSMTAPSIAFC